MTPPDGGFLDWLFGGQAPNGWQILLAIVIIVAGWILSIFARRAVLALARRLNGITPDAANLIARIVKYAIILLSFGVALTLLGAPLQPLLTGAIIVAVIIAIALRGIAENFASGVVIQSRHLVKIGDELETNDLHGVVAELTGRAVVLTTTDGKTIHVPNSLVLSTPLINLSEAHGRRAEIEVRVDGPAALSDDTRELLSASALGTSAAHKRPPPTVLLLSSTHSHATYRVRFWHASDRHDDALDEVATALSRAIADRGLDAVVIWPPPPPPLTPQLPY